MAAIVRDLLPSAPAGSLAAAALLLLILSLCVYRAYLDPLKHVPGPLICRLTSLWIIYHGYIGDECSQIRALHEKYGPVVRIAPNEVVIADGSALNAIYIEKGGFMKAPCYSNYDFEGHATIFSTLDPQYRSVRSKAVSPLFSSTRLRSHSHEIEACADTMTARLQDEAELSKKTARDHGKPKRVDLLDISRSMAIDGMTSYLFGHQYGGVDERGKGKLSATGFVDTLVGVGRLIYLPHWLFLILDMALPKIFPNAEQDTSCEKVGSFTASLVEKSSQLQGDSNTYQGRLLSAGVSHHEADVQCRDALFAGTDSTGNNIATVIWHMAKNPQIYATLRAEIAHADATLPADYNPQSLPYLDAVVREGLRVAMANPARFPREVPAAGYSFTPSPTWSATPRSKEEQPKQAPSTFHFPPGTLVGLQSYTLHLNPAVFEDPFTFKPERWLEKGGSGGPTPEMVRDWIPFGLGPRGCIARNLATTELFLAARAVARSGVLEGARPVGDKIEMYQWFLSRVIGDRMDLVWE